MICDEMWNSVTLYGRQAEIDRFKELFIDVPDDDGDETLLAFDAILPIARAESLELFGKVARCAGFQTWNFRDSIEQILGTYYFAFDTGNRFPVPVFNYLAILFPELAFDCYCIADNDSSMGFGWFNPPPGGEDFCDEHSVPVDHWEGNGRYRIDPIAHEQHERLRALVAKQAYDLSVGN